MRRIGRLNERITIRQDVAAPGGFKQTPNWQTLVADLPARVRPLNANEQMRQDRITTVASYEITIRLREDVEEKMEIDWRGRTLNIGSVVNDYDDDATIITATEAR